MDNLGNISTGVANIRDLAEDLSYPIKNSSELLYQLSSNVQADDLRPIPTSRGPLGGRMIKPVKPISPARPVPKTKIQKQPEPGPIPFSPLTPLSEDLKKLVSQRPPSSRAPATHSDPETYQAPMKDRVKLNLQNEFVAKMGLSAPTELVEEVSDQIPAPILPSFVPASFPPVDHEEVGELIQRMDEQIRSLDSLRSQLLAYSGEETDDLEINELKALTRKVLSKLDELMDYLPEDAVAEFADSPEFQDYERLLQLLGLG
jgi:hypothetical protein